VKALEEINVPYRIVVEPQEFDNYAEVIDPSKILVLPFSNLGLGSIPARNWVWEHSIADGHHRHWILDDNISAFWRQNRNLRIKVADGTIFRCCEDFVDRYDNVAKAGMNYYMFAPDRAKNPAFFLNTRVYSCILLRNDIDFRWRGRYNEDTDLSLNILKAGWCTVLFNAFLAQKMPTLTMKGGNTDELYANTELAFEKWLVHQKYCDECKNEKPWRCDEAKEILKDDGRWKMALALFEQHPDVTVITRKWGRWQHQVNYKPFRKAKLSLKPGVQVQSGVDNYGMRIIEVKPKRESKKA
jgi:hypothetical protein